MSFHITPQEDAFFELFETQTKNAITASSLLGDLLAAAPTEREAIATQIRQVEHNADHDCHIIINKINSSFVTPFDRDDLYELTSTLDDCVDYMEDGSDCIVLYKINDVPAKIFEQVAILQKMALLTVEAMPKLKTMSHLKDYWIEINQLENQADDVRRALLVDLFDSGRDAVDILKYRDIVEAFEQCADTYEHVADITETIATKES